MKILFVMRKRWKNQMLLQMFCLLVVLSGTACNRKVGCPSNVASNVDLSESPKGKKYTPKSGLFPKSMQRGNR